MLQIEVPMSPEGWDEAKQEFVEPKVEVLKLEHSLVSISKWESKWNKPFLTNDPKTDEEIFDYIKCMATNPNTDPDVYNHLTQANIADIHKYIEAPMTATTFSKEAGGRGGREIVTSELIYYWMIALNIPVEFQKWHINRLMTLIKVCDIKNTPPKKRSKSDIISQNAALNAARRKKLNTTG